MATGARTNRLNGEEEMSATVADRPRRTGRSQQRTARQILKEVAVPKAAKMVAKWRLLTLVEEEERVTLHYLTDHKGEAAYTVVRDQDGTLHWEDWNSALAMPLSLSTIHIEAKAYKKIQELLDEIIAGELGFDPYTDSERRLEPVEMADLERGTSMAAQQLAMSKLNRTGLPKPYPRSTSINSVADLAEHVTKTCIADPATLDLAERLINTNRAQRLSIVARVMPFNNMGRWANTGIQATKNPSADRYNHVHASREALHALALSALHAAHYYVLAMLHEPGAAPVKMNHPGQIISAVKGKLQLRPAEWKIFLRTGLEPYGRPEDPNTVQQIRASCHALAAANRPKADINLVIEAATQHTQHARFFELDRQYPGAWGKWVNTVGRFLEDDGEPRQRNSLLDAADALRHHVENGQPWGDAPWPSLARRTARWHNQANMNRYRANRPPGSETATWKVPLERIEAGELTMVAIKSTKQLDATGEELQNCLPMYLKQCQEGRTVIFRIERDGKLIAAAACHKVEYGWNLGQVEGPKYERAASTEAREAAQEALETLRRLG